MASLNLRAVSFVLFLFAWFGTAYRLPHGKRNRKEVGGDGVGNTKSDGGEPVDAATTGGRTKSSSDIFAQGAQWKNKEGAKPLVGEVHGVLMKEHDTERSSRSSEERVRTTASESEKIGKMVKDTNLTYFGARKLLQLHGWDYYKAINAHNSRKNPNPNVQEKWRDLAKIQHVKDATGMKTHREAEKLLKRHGSNASRAINAYFEALKRRQDQMIKQVQNVAGINSEVKIRNLLENNNWDVSKAINAHFNQH